MNAARPLLVASLGARDLDGAAQDARTLPKPVDLVELRLDRFADPRAIDLAAARAALGRPAILTLRPRAEGGEFDGDAAARRATLERGDGAGFEWIDLEADVAAAVRRGRAKRIVSWHGVATDPPQDAGAKVAELARLDADVVKVAAEHSSATAALRFVTAASSAQVAPARIAAIAMGAHGRFLRPLAGRFGAPLVYTAARGSRKTAAGQLTAREFLDVYRAADVGATTRVLAVVGRDVSSSLSPAAHGAAIRALGADAVYVDLSVATFDDAMTVARELPIDGMSVTAPFKAAALAAASSADDAARAIGAANTLVRDAAGNFAAANTDAPGFLAAIDLAADEPGLAEEICIGRSFDALANLRDDDNGVVPRTALVFGGGGVARAIAFALRERGTKVSVTARDFSQATTLALAIPGVIAVTQERARSQGFDVLAKAFGGKDSIDRHDFDPTDFRGEGLAADVDYRPLDTPFLRAARKHGRIPVPGILMFAAQAALQSARFFGVDADEVRDAIADGIAREFGAA